MTRSWFYRLMKELDVRTVQIAVDSSCSILTRGADETIRVYIDSLKVI